MNDFAWVMWFMNCEWWIGCYFGMWFEWDGWYESGMVAIWNTILYSWCGKDELAWIQHLDMNEDGLQRWAWDLYAWWVFLYCLIMIGRWSVHNSLKSLGEISGSCFSDRVHNSMTPVSGNSWWCAIYIVW